MDAIVLVSASEGQDDTEVPIAASVSTVPTSPGPSLNFIDSNFSESSGSGSDVDRLRVNSRRCVKMECRTRSVLQKDMDLVKGLRA